MEKDSKEVDGIKKAAFWYNQIPILFWSALNLAPIGYFCYTLMEPAWLYGFLIFCLTAAFFPKSLMDALQVGKNGTVYQKIGVRIVKKYTQDGDVVNKWMRKRFPAYRILESEASLKQQFRKAYSYEKLHLAMFLFFLFASAYAVIHGYLMWAFVIAINNVIFNIYPILLQQYNRLRLQKALQKQAANQKG